MKKGLIALAGLTLIAALAEGLILARIRIDPWKLGAVLENFTLLMGVFVGLTSAAFVRQLRHWAVASPAAALAPPFLLVVPYLIYALGTGSFSLLALGKLVAYIAVPTALLWPDRLHNRERIGWRDVAASLALAVPVAAHWLEDIWMWPQNLYLFRPIYCVLVGGYGFMVLRNLDGVGYRLVWRADDVSEALMNLVGFALPAIPLGIVLGFLHPHSNPDLSAGRFILEFIGIYLTVAIPEEFLFRGVLQNLLARSIQSGPRGLYGLLITSVVFGLAHLHHAPVPNWRYAILATLAGIFYGNTFRARQRLCASGLTHALVDTIWHFWL
jgi:membrane protease YdiL (CAAX protease family)